MSQCDNTAASSATLRTISDDENGSTDRENFTDDQLRAAVDSDDQSDDNPVGDSLDGDTDDHDDDIDDDNSRATVISGDMQEDALLTRSIIESTDAVVDFGEQDYV